ncbi:hypothetical protein N7603_01555 [Acholeplasma vituli]|uniref:Apolipoprotein N-acyltransferase n=1 Tax=Paracholeplasma vituli TaxID=69473 RepID=A0ABT2PTQ4_9MOLU|nr:hypothetical protein [Paracholeplasma vituli]MCU0104338.1 hypothetical protein [Paracholeplasma vituli]
MKKRLLAAMPLISLMLFLGAWLYYEKLELGMTFFLLIPLSWILLTGNFFKRLSEIVPFVSLLLFLWLGFGLGYWHPGWLVFFLIPLTNIIVERKIDARKFVGIVVTAAYITLGLVYDTWHPTWIMFLLIPIINTLFFPQKNAYVTIKTQSFRFGDVVDADIEDKDRK